MNSYYIWVSALLVALTLYVKRFLTSWTPKKTSKATNPLFQTNNQNKNNTAETDTSPAKTSDGMIIRAFKGYHPPAELMSAVASPPYDVIHTEEARAVCKDNAKSFLNINKPQIQFPAGTDQYSDKVYAMGRRQIEKFCANKWLIQDKKPCLYIYSQRMGNHEQFGIVAEASAIQYEKDLIKKHELTRKMKEDDRTKLTDIQSANVGPIFLCYKAVKEINEFVNKYILENKTYSDFISDDNIQHKLWIIKENKIINQLTQIFMKKVPCSYVADGHHRTASAWRVYKKRRQELEKLNKYTGKESFHYFLAVFFPHNHLQILAYNRIVNNFGYIYTNKDRFLNAISKDWIFDKIEMKTDILKTEKPNDFRMYIYNDGWYKLMAKQHVINKVQNDVVECLDVSILSNYLLQPVMGIIDIRSDPSIDFIGGIHGLSALKKKVDANKNGVAFGLYHTTIDQLLNVADNNRLMPPKSTWFEPKLRSGVVMRRF